MERGVSTSAPVVVFAYKRPEHLRRTIESLLANPLARETDLVIYCDGAKAPKDAAFVAAVLAYAQSVDGFASLAVRTRKENFGLANSVIAGVTEMLTQHPAVIVLEDDLLLSPHFLAYMNEALCVYENEERVASIHAYCYPVGVALPETFFLRGADCWGWATWRRGWSRFRTEGQELLSELEARCLTRTLDLDGSYPFTQMLRDQVAGINDSWAIRWYASCFLDDALTLYPGRSLVHNIGNDASGTHSGRTREFDQAVAQSPISMTRVPVQASSAARDAFIRYFRATRGSLAKRALDRMRRRLL